VRCETVDLVVPATSEIVIEGTMFPGKLRDEGLLENIRDILQGQKPESCN